MGSREVRTVLEMRKELEAEDERLAVRRLFNNASLTSLAKVGHSHLSSIAM